MDRRAKLNDVYPDWKLGGGIFSLMQAYEPPWEEEFAGDEELLDYLYHGGVSGSKTISPLIRNFVADDEPTLEEQTVIARMALTMFGPSWSKEYATLSAEYNPIQNYDMVEEETPAETTETETPAETTKTITPAETTDTDTPAETTETVTPAETTKTITPAAITHTTKPAETTDTADRTDGIFGFNNSTALSDPANDSKGKNVLTVQTAGTDVLSVQTAGSEVMETDEAETRQLEVNTAGSVARTVQNPGTEVLTVDNDRTLTRKTDKARKLTRSGNIGVTSSQQLLQSERDLWVWNFFRDVVFPDLDSVLVLGIY